MTFLRPMDDPTTANASLNSGYDSSPSTVTFKRDPSLGQFMFLAFPFCALYSALHSRTSD